MNCWNAFFLMIKEIDYPLALEVLLMALNGAGSYLLILGFIFPHVYLNSSSYCWLCEPPTAVGICPWEI